MAAVYDPSHKGDFFAKPARDFYGDLQVILATLVAAIAITTNDFRWVFEQAAYASAFASNIGY